jgi:hypothetical protein
VAHLLDGVTRTEYSSNSKGIETVVEFEFLESVRLAGFRHVDRNDPATIAESELVMLDETGREQGRLMVEHANRKGGITFQAFPQPVETRRVRWQVTKLGSQNFGTVGGAEVAFYRAGESQVLPTPGTMERFGNSN